MACLKRQKILRRYHVRVLLLLFPLKLYFSTLSPLKKTVFLLKKLFFFHFSYIVFDFYHFQRFTCLLFVNAFHFSTLYPTFSVVDLTLSLSASFFPLSTCIKRGIIFHTQFLSNCITPIHNTQDDIYFKTLMFRLLSKKNVFFSKIIK